MHPFNIREALLAKHAQHVVLIHFPIALCMAGVAFDFVAYWTKRGALATAAYYNFTVAAVFTVPVIATGLLAWQFQLEGEKLKGILLQHLILGVVSSVMICLVWYVHFRARRTPDQTLPRYCFAIELAAMGLVAMTAHLGGYLSGVNISG
ncbi:MAG TPA: DUF2231 domain-containing protein [Candidatus Acidoferrales bacterium]|jgi:uncharacterized membrane protein|nr:DUF2231 domain-containing protein [Candidatus Acidoferrales bacterium]